MGCSASSTNPHITQDNKPTAILPHHNHHNRPNEPLSPISANIINNVNNSSPAHLLRKPSTASVNEDEEENKENPRNSKPLRTLSGYPIATFDKNHQDCSNELDETQSFLAQTKDLESPKNLETNRNNKKENNNYIVAAESTKLPNNESSTLTSTVTSVSAVSTSSYRSHDKVKNSSTAPSMQRPAKTVVPKWNLNFDNEKFRKANNNNYPDTTNNTNDQFVHTSDTAVAAHTNNSSIPLSTYSKSSFQAVGRSLNIEEEILLDAILDEES
jgi:hypothetical protein